eukprot:gene23620-biopygen8742
MKFKECDSLDPRKHQDDGPDHMSISIFFLAEENGPKKGSFILPPSDKTREQILMFSVDISNPLVNSTASIITTIPRPRHTFFWVGSWVCVDVHFRCERLTIDRGATAPIDCQPLTSKMDIYAKDVHIGSARAQRRGVCGCARRNVREVILAIPDNAVLGRRVHK